MKAAGDPSDLELQILSLMWEKGPMTARAVLDRMPDGKKRAYTSILSTLQVMEKKSLLTHRVAGQAHVYRPKVGRSHVLGRLLGKLVEHVFGGNPSAAVQSLLQQTPVSADELAEIQRVVAEHAAAAKTNRREHDREGKR